MPGAIPAALIAWWAAYGTYVMVAIVVVSTAYSILTRPDEPGTPHIDALGDPGLRTNTRNTQEMIKVLYGTQKVGGNDVYMATSGSDNSILWIVQTLCEGHCDSIKQVGGADQVWLGDKLESEFGALVSYYFHGGENNQTVDANLTAAVPDWTDTLRNTCYIVWKLTFDRNYFQGLPQRMVEVKGKILYDFRDASTAWSDNPVLCLYDYVTNKRYGCGISSTKIDTTSWTSAANYCDTKGWALNMALTSDQAAVDIVNAICSHFRGALIWYDGKYYLRYADLNDESSLMAITDEHIVQDESGRAQISVSEPSVFDKPDAVRVKFIDPEKSYAADDVIVGDDSGVVKEIALLGCTDREMAANLGVYNLERWQLNRIITGRFRGDALQLDPHDVITLTSTALAVSGQLMRIREANLLPDQTVELSMVYEDEDLYNDDYDLIEENVYSCTLPDPNDEPPPVSNALVTEETYNYRLRTFTRLKVTFDKPANYAWFDHVEVWLSYDDATWEHMFDSTDDFEIANVEEGATYYIRLKSVNLWGVKQNDTNDRKLSKLVNGYIDAPDSVGALYAVVTQSAVNLYANKLADTDVELYEFRLGTAWSSGIFLGALRAPNLSLAGVKPGSHTFLLNTLSNNGIYGSTAQTATASLIDPPDGWAVHDSDTDDYSAGTHDNTEQIDYSGEHYLKCSHTGNVLTGTYKSPVFDLGGSARYLVYVLCDVVVTGAGTKWEDIAPSPLTWDQIGTSNTWGGLVQLNAAPAVSIKVLYGDASPPTGEMSKMEILSGIVTARYYQVEITITDPSSEINALVQQLTIKYCDPA